MNISPCSYDWLCLFKEEELRRETDHFRSRHQEGRVKSQTGTSFCSFLYQKSTSSLKTGSPHIRVFSACGWYSSPEIRNCPFRSKLTFNVKECLSPSPGPRLDRSSLLFDRLHDLPFEQRSCSSLRKKTRECSWREFLEESNASTAWLLFSLRSFTRWLLVKNYKKPLSSHWRSIESTLRNRMSSTGANRESEGGTMKNVVDDPLNKPQVYNDADDKNQPKPGTQSSQPGSGPSQSKPASNNNNNDNQPKK